VPLPPPLAAGRARLRVYLYLFSSFSAFYVGFTFPSEGFKPVSAGGASCFVAGTSGDMDCLREQKR
jgi:hypothetical protein